MCLLSGVEGKRKREREGVERENSRQVCARARHRRDPDVNSKTESERDGRKLSFQLEFRLSSLALPPSLPLLRFCYLLCTLVGIRPNSV